ncbi:MAG: PrgI family protein [Candidatus Moranbacteria bacterium]|nr:PrgI family protein [Candidatus Moranbacteria bacterium]
MLINVPQYIDVEDKIAGPLTAKQLGWIIILGIILIILWNVVPMAVFFIIGIPVTILFVSLAFYRPYGQPLASFFLYGIMYFFRPKIYIWKRTPEKIVSTVQKIQTAATVAPDKHISSQSLQDLAQLLDSEGTTSNAELEKILKQAPGKR